MAAQYLTEWKQYIDTEMAYTIITGFQSKQGEKEGSSEGDMSEIAGGEEDVLSDLSADDSELVRAILSGNSVDRVKGSRVARDDSETAIESSDL